MVSPVLDDLDPVRLRAVQEVLLDPSLVLRATRDPDDDLVDFVCEDANQGAADGLEMDREALVGSLLSQVLPGETGDFLFEQCLDCGGIRNGACDSTTSQVPIPTAGRPGTSTSGDCPSATGSASPGGT